MHGSCLFNSAMEISSACFLPQHRPTLDGRDVRRVKGCDRESMFWIECVQLYSQHITKVNQKLLADPLCTHN